MSNYIFWGGKKRLQLKRREAELCRLLDRGADVRALIHVAEQIREARIRVLRSAQAELDPRDGPASLPFERIEASIEACQALTPDQILDEYRRQSGPR